MASKRQKMWLPVPPKKVAPKVPELVKTELKKQADEIIENEIKSKNIKLPPTDNDYNYLVDIYSKWYRHYFHFCAKYNCPSPNAISPSFETKFARMEYIGDNKFNLSYMRHTDQWWEIYRGLSMDECLDLISDGGYFAPH